MLNCNVIILEHQTITNFKRLKIMLGTKEFYDVMNEFEKAVKQTPFVRPGSSGMKKEDKEKWSKGIYYCDGNINQAFRIFLTGFTLGKFMEKQNQNNE